MGQEKGGRVGCRCVFCWGFVCSLLAGAERLQVKGGGQKEGGGSVKGGEGRVSLCICWGFVCSFLAGAERLQVKGGEGKVCLVCWPFSWGRKAPGKRGGGVRKKGGWVRCSSVISLVVVCWLFSRGRKAPGKREGVA